jgi:hypothetical protein
LSYGAHRARSHFSLVTPSVIVTFVDIQPTPISAVSSRAVFPSYASQDAEAARRTHATQ